VSEEAVGFNYLDENVWVRYAEEVLLPVHAKASAILDTWRDARERLNGRKLSELLGDEGIARVLLGGVKEDGSRPDNSVAGFYAGVLGINSSAGNDYYRQYIEAVRRNLSPGIQVSVADAGSVPFLSFVKFIQENASAAYYRMTGRRPEPRPERVDFARVEELAALIHKEELRDLLGHLEDYGFGGRVRVAIPFLTREGGGWRVDLVDLEDYRRRLQDLRRRMEEAARASDH
jgi:hypothetical protein